MKNMKQHPSESSLRRVEPDVAVTKLENSHRRRLRIRRMKYSCKSEARVGNGFAGGTETEIETETKLVFSENERREIHESVEISLSLASSLTSEEEDRSKKRNGGVLSHGFVSLMGKRKEMEDAVSVEVGFTVKESAKCDFFAVYDGHGGAQVAEACKERLHLLVAEEVERFGNDDVEWEWEWERVMEGCFSKMDREVAGNAANRTVGSTAVVTVVAKTEIVVANCGDSRAVLGRGGEAVDLSCDHKPDRPDELMRIEEAGGRVINWNGQRVLGVLATSRSIGPMGDHSDHDSGHDGDAENYIRKHAPRGMTVKKNIINRINKGKGKLSVQWNTKDQPIGRNGTELISFVGSKVKQMIPITMESWGNRRDKVLNKQKDEFWLTIQNHFELDESRKDFVMKLAGRVHRNFRATLTREEIKDHNGNIQWNPPVLYNGFITEEVWCKFVSSRLENPKFLEKSKVNKERASHNEYPYRGGASGYQMIEERELVEQGKDPTKESLARHVLWVAARKNNDGEVVDPMTMEVAQRIETISQSVSQGELTDCSEKEVLNRALEREEYNGRTRGCGLGVNPRKYLGTKKQARVEQSDCQQCGKLLVMVEGLQGQMNELREQCGLGSPAVPSPAIDSARDSCTIPSTKDNNECECELYISNPHQMVAIGFPCYQLGPLMHNLPIHPDHVRVKVVCAIVGDALLPVPLPNMDLEIVQDAVGTYVAWPKNLVVVRQNAKSSARSVGKANSTSKKVSRSGPSTQVSQPAPPPSKVTKPTPAQIVNQSTHHSKVTKPAPPQKVTKPVRPPKVASQPPRHPEVFQPSTSSIDDTRFIISVHMHAETKMDDATPRVINMDYHIFGRTNEQLTITKQDVLDFCNMAWATGTSIRVYVRCLYENILVPSERTQRFLFLCPDTTHLRDFEEKYKHLKEQNRREVKSYVTQRLREAQNTGVDTMLLAPFLLSEHWILLAINPKDDMVYYIDSGNGHYNYYDELVEMINSCLQDYWGFEISKTKWLSIFCPRQPNNNDCGYYVMKFMKEIITHNEMIIPKTFFRNCCERYTYSHAELDELRGEWCRYVYKYL